MPDAWRSATWPRTISRRRLLGAYEFIGQARRSRSTLRGIATIRFIPRWSSGPIQPPLVGRRRQPDPGPISPPDQGPRLEVRLPVGGELWLAQWRGQGGGEGFTPLKL